MDPVGPAASGCGHPCDQTLPTLSDALAAAATWQATMGPGQVQVCARGTAPMFESIDVDNTGLVYGSPFSLSFAGGPLCGDQGASPSEPVFRWTPGPADWWNGLSLDLRSGGACGTPVRRPGVHLQGPNPTHADSFTLQGTVDYGIGNGLDGPPSQFIADGFGHFIGNCEGSAVRTAGLMSLRNIAVAGCHVSGATGGSAIL